LEKANSQISRKFDEIEYRKKLVLIKFCLDALKYYRKLKDSEN